MDVKLSYVNLKYYKTIYLEIDGDEWVVPVADSDVPESVAIAKGLKQLYYILMNTYGGMQVNENQLELFSEEVKDE